MKRILLTTSALSLFTTFVLQAQELKLNLSKGKKFTVQNTLSVVTAAEVMGQTMETNIGADMTTTFEITEAKTEGYDLVSTTTNIKSNMSMMGQEMNYNSEDKNSSGPLADGFKDLVNKPRNISIDTKGKTLKEDAAGIAPEGMMSIIETAKPSAEDLVMPVLFGKELSAGLTINDSIDNKTEKSSTKETGVYTVNSIENGVASISYSGIQKTTAVVEQMGMEMNTKGDNKVTKEIKIDMATGTIVAKKTTVDLNTTVEVQGMVILSTGKSTSTITVQ